MLKLKYPIVIRSIWREKNITMPREHFVVINVAIIDNQFPAIIAVEIEIQLTLALNIQRSVSDDNDDDDFNPMDNNAECLRSWGNTRSFVRVI